MKTTQILNATRIFRELYVGRKTANYIRQWIPSVATLGTVGIVYLAFVVDYEPVNKYVPFYGNKFRYPEDDKNVYLDPIE